jgi:hypothetical protein
MYPLGSSPDFRLDLSSLALGDTHSRAPGKSGSTGASRVANDRLAFLRGRHGHGRLDVVGKNVAVAIHPSAHSFQTAAGDYERARPDYSDEAGRWLAERLDLRPGRKVADIAAGTGKLTRALVATGAKVAVEPVAGTRERLAAGKHLYGLVVPGYAAGRNRALAFGGRGGVRTTLSSPSNDTASSSNGNNDIIA